ncbi:MAG: hypothetical protein U5R14_14055 [Gemmatimonadota bacterium]|nr:hypothetical protein [Gemmatimonadota bacterium]
MMSLGRRQGWAGRLVGCTVVTLFFGALAESLSAQIGQPVGVSAGVVSANWRGSEYERDDTQPLTGIRFEVNTRFPISGELSVLVAGVYAEKGAHEPVRGDFGYRVRIRYLEAPVLLQFELPSYGRFTPRVHVGPYVGVRLDCRVNVVPFLEPDDPDTVGCDTVSIRPGWGDVGVVAGAGAKLDLGGSLAVTISARREWGLRSVSVGSRGNANNRAFSFLAGLEFDPGR